MNTSDFHYDIPESLIADTPPAVRGNARLLHLDRKSGQIQDKNYADITTILQSGDVLIINDTKVIKARLMAQKTNGAMRELVLVEQHGRVDDWHRHKVVYRGRLRPGDTLHIGSHTVIVETIEGDGIATIKSQTNLLTIASEHGTVPLPPYMRREANARDIERYQTVWANHEGSVAAPTASLNMTAAMLETLSQNGVIVRYATLHVGLGTFLPIRVNDVTKHTMHKEYFEIPAKTVAAIQAAKKDGRRVIALGTTITRTLEYAHQSLRQEPPQELSGEADIFMYPGYVFRTIDGLITNFHAPESTVLMLTAAFAGWDKLQPAYQHAVAERYRFFSYGDSMIII